MAKSNGFCHTFGGSPYGRPPQPASVPAIWAGFAFSLLLIFENYFRQNQRNPQQFFAFNFSRNSLTDSQLR